MLVDVCRRSPQMATPKHVIAATVSLCLMCAASVPVGPAHTVVLYLYSDADEYRDNFMYFIDKAIKGHSGTHLFAIVPQTTVTVCARDL
jgi:hypothetical protein